MVEATAGQYAKIEADLFQQALKMIQSRDSLKVVKEDSGIQVRQVWDENNNLISFATLEAHGIVPEQAKAFFDNWANEIKSVNPLIIKAAVIDQAEGFDVVRYDAKMPFPLDNRVFFCVKSVRTIEPGTEYMMLMTSTGNEPFIAKHFSDPKDRKGLTIGTVAIVCWRFSAIKDESGKVVGSEITYAFSVNPGGSIPKSMT